MDKKGWDHIKKIGSGPGRFYVHLSNYFTTVKREAERKARMMEKEPNTTAKVVHRRIRGGDGKTRTVYTVYVHRSWFSM